MVYIVFRSRLLRIGLMVLVPHHLTRDKLHESVPLTLIIMPTTSIFHHFLSQIYIFIQAEFQFLSFEGYNRQLAAKMQNLGGVLCSICLNYMVKPVTTKCGHSFCEYCLDEYFLLMDTCAVCEKQIRNSLSYASNVLGEFVENFVREQHGDKWVEYQNRQEEAAKWKHNKRIGGLKVGMKVDIRDKHYIWCEGVVIRIISRVGESHKFLKVQYLDYEDKVQQDLRVISERLANHGFYTTRGDIPRYKEKIKSIKNSPLIMNPI